MLTRDLLRFNTSGNYLKPQFISTDDSKLLHLSSSLLEIYHSSAGETRESIEEMCQALVNQYYDLKLSKGLLKLLDDRAEYTSFQDLDYPQLRHSLFLTSASLLKNNTTVPLPKDPAEVKDFIFGKTQETVSVLRDGIYADLPENETLIGVKKTFPRELLERYNVSLVQSLILHAACLEAEICEPDASKLRRLMSYLKFFRLLVTAEFKKNSKESKLLLRVDGPASILENSTKYGLQLACFFPALCKMEQWKIACDVKMKTKTKRLLLSSEDAPLKCTYDHFSAYIPEEIRLFSAHFKEKVPDWNIDSAPPFLKLESQKLIFPDFRFTHRNGHHFDLELFHRWHSGQFEERLSFYEKALNTPPLLLGLDRALLKKDGILKERIENSPYFEKYGFLFRDFPGVENVLKRLNG